MQRGKQEQRRVWAIAFATVAVAWLGMACEPTFVIGSCPAAAGGEAGADTVASDAVVGTSWSTGFEDGWCGYLAEQGYCYARHDASLEIVSAPAPHSGKFAAAFTVNGNATTEERSQARCVRQGQMPKSAIYGAWYLVPATQFSDGNWNLFHFLGGEADGNSHALWDVSLASNSDGALVLSVFDFLTGTHPPLSGVPPIPIGTWFHIEVQLTRSAQANGELTVYQDGIVALHLSHLVTDDSHWGEWYVGNYARVLVPALSTLYVDDVTIREAL